MWSETQKSWHLCACRISWQLKNFYLQPSAIDGIDGLCVLLRRFSYPSRYLGLIPRFGQPVPVLSMVFGSVTNHMYTIHGHRIADYSHSILDPILPQVYTNAVFAKGAAFDNCFGFVDGTVRPFCRPGEIRCKGSCTKGTSGDGLKFQSVVLCQTDSLQISLDPWSPWSPNWYSVLQKKFPKTDTPF